MADERWELPDTSSFSSGELSSREKIIDWAQGLANASDDPDLYREILEAFLQERMRIDEEFRRAQEARDAVRLHRAAHTMKGSLQAIGAESALPSVLRLEETAKAERLDETPALIAELTAEIYKLTNVLNDYLDQI